MAEAEDLSHVHDEHNQVLMELCNKKFQLKEKVNSIEKMDLLINILTYKIYEEQHEFRTEMDRIQRQREFLLSRQDLTPSEIALAVSELDKTLFDKKNSSEQNMSSLQGQKQELELECSEMMKMLDDNLTTLKMQYDNLIAELEIQKRDATPSELSVIEKKLAELNTEFSSDLIELVKLRETGWKDLNSEEQISAILQGQGMKFTMSGRILTNSGQLLTLQEAEHQGLLEKTGTSWQTLCKKYKLLQNASSVSTSSKSSEVSSVFSRMSSEDVHYLKQCLGKPLTLALAEIAAKQPQDPIHYLGHWLFKCRYNQEVDMTQKQEVEELIEERERLAKERWHQMVQEEAEQIVLGMIVKAEEEALQNELERELKRFAEEEENEGMYEEGNELEAETLGN